MSTPVSSRDDVLIEVENFQSVREARLELRGFCVLVGESDVGKSAVVRALASLAQNLPAAAAVTRGEKQAVVRVTLRDGRSVEWVRRASGASYRVAVPGSPPLVLDKLGRDVPEPVAALRLFRLVTPESAELLSLVPQGHYLKFLDDARAIVRVAGELRAISVLNDALALARKARRDAAAAEHVQDELAARAGAQADALSPAAALARRADAALALEREVEGLAVRRTSVQVALTRYARALSLVAAADARALSLAPVRALGERLRAVRAPADEVSTLAARVARARALVPNLRAAAARRARAHDLDAALVALPGAGVADAALREARRDRLRAASAKLREVEARAGRARARLAALAPVSAVDLALVDGLDGLRAALARARSAFFAAAASRAAAFCVAAAAADDVHRSRDEVDAHLREHPDCEVCGSRVDLAALGLPGAPVRDGCEWCPSEDRRAQAVDAHHRAVPAAFILGRDAEWRLCAPCADLPRFARFSVRRLVAARPPGAE